MCCCFDNVVSVIMVDVHEAQIAHALCRHGSEKLSFRATLLPFVDVLLAQVGVRARLYCSCVAACVVYTANLVTLFSSHPRCCTGSMCISMSCRILASWSVRQMRCVTASERFLDRGTHRTSVSIPCAAPRRLAYSCSHVRATIAPRPSPSTQRSTLHPRL